MTVKGELVTMLRTRLMVLLLVCCYTATYTKAMVVIVSLLFSIMTFF